MSEHKVLCSEHCEEHEHHHEHNENIKIEFIIAGICGLLFLLSFLPALQKYTLVLCLIASLFAGRETIIAGIKGIFRLDFDEEALMTIAIVAAFIIGEYREGAMVALLFSLGEALEDYAVERSKKRIGALADIRPDSANVVTDEGISLLPAKDIPIGTKILVKVGERVPLDSVALSETFADTSALTGESLPKSIAEGETLKAGYVVMENAVYCETTSGYGESAAARIIDMVQSSAEKKGNTEKFISRFCKIYTPVVIGMAVLVFLIPRFFGNVETTEALHRALVFLVSSCPCALVLSVPLAFFAGIGSASKNGVLIKGSDYCERLASIKNAVFDKTGTLTLGKLHIEKLVATEGLDENELLRFAAAAESFSTHPIAKSVVEGASQKGLHIPTAENITEYAGKGISATVEGREILCGSKKLFEHLGISVNGEDNASLLVTADGVLMGSIFLSDTIRPEVSESIAALRSLGVEKTYILTGDSESAARTVAEKCGIDAFFASLLPENKVEKIQWIKKSGASVFVGDGINDAPVLAAADVGVAMGMGSDAAIESADIVLMKGGISALPKAIALSKKIMSCVSQNVIFIMAVKIVVLILGAFGYAPIWLGVFADVGVCLLALLWSLRLLKVKV